MVLKFKRKYKGLSLIEIIIALALFFMLTSGVALIAIEAIRSARNDEIRAAIGIQVNQVSNLIFEHKNNHWVDMIQNTDDGNKSIVVSGSTTQVQDGSLTQNGVESYFTISSVMRDGSGNIVTSGGVIDPYTRKIDINFQWIDILGVNQLSTYTMYVNDWNTTKWTDTTAANFNAGTHNETQTVANGDGEVELATVFFPDWCNPSLSVSEYDIPGSAQSRTVFADIGHAYLGTGGEATGGEPFTKLNIAEVDPPILSVEGTFGGYTVNDIFVIGNYAFLATTDDSKEVVILDITSTPYSEIGYFNASGSSNAYSVFVSGTTGYVAQGRVLRTFNLSAYTGSRAAIGSITVAGFFGYISQIYVYQNYVYQVLYNDWYELVIVNATNPASMSITSETSVNDQQVLDMYINANATRAYFGTNSSSQKEFWILDIAAKSGARPVISSTDTNGMTVKGIAVVENENVAVLGGTGAEEYQVFNISNKSAPSKCGGMNVNSGIYDVDSIIDLDGNAFSYIITGDTAHEFKIMRGGPGGGSGTGYGYVDAGEFTSQVFDSTNVGAQYYYLFWLENLPAGSNIRFQVRSAATSAMTGATWIGPDGTGATYFDNPNGDLISSVLNNKRYFQYKAYLTGDTITTPSLQEISIIYSD